MSACVEWVGEGHCGRAGHSVSLPCPAGRPDATGGPYCSGHGGLARAREEAEREWIYQAPESVGDEGAVLAAGSRGLNSTHAYVVVRPRSEHGIWLAWLGLGSMLTEVPRPDYAGCGGANCRRCREGRYCGRRQHAHRTREEATQAATDAWRVHVAETIAAIRAARGDTLAWGVPIEPLTEPHVIELPDHGSAWDLAQALPRVAPAGLSMISGVRSSGEAH